MTELQGDKILLFPKERSSLHSSCIVNQLKQRSALYLPFSSSPSKAPQDLVSRIVASLHVSKREYWVLLLKIDLLLQKQLFLTSAHVTIHSLDIDWQNLTNKVSSDDVMNMVLTSHTQFQVGAQKYRSKNLV